MVRAPLARCMKTFLEAQSEAVALGGGLLRSYAVPSANHSAFWGPRGKPIVVGACTGHRHVRHNRIQGGSWGLWGLFLTEFGCWI